MGLVLQQSGPSNEDRVSSGVTRGTSHVKRSKQSTVYLYMAVPVVLLGFALRARYMQQSHPYVDEYFTMLAADMVQQRGLPLLPSGLLYTHGFLYTYVAALLGWPVNATGPSAGISQVEMIYRVPNLLLGPVSMSVLYFVANRWFGRRAAIVAVAFMAVYPHGIVWGARVRMYTLVFTLVPLLAYAFFRAGLKPEGKWRHVLALFLLAVAVFTHNWMMVLLPLMVIGAVMVGLARGASLGRSKSWLLLDLIVIAALAALSSRLESLWLTVPGASSQDTGWQGFLGATLGRLDLAKSIASNAEFVKELIWDNPFNMPVLALTLLGVIGLIHLWRLHQRGRGQERHLWPMLYLYLLFVGAVTEFLLLVTPEIKQTQYASPILLLAFIILGGWVEIGLSKLPIHLHFARSAAARRLHVDANRLQARTNLLTPVIVLGLLVSFGRLAELQIPKMFYEGLPPLAYEEAFQFVQANSASADAVLSPIPAAAYLYLGTPGYFIAQDATQTFVHVNPQGMLADRWAGAQWLRTSDELKQTLRDFQRVWLVIDSPTFNSQFHSDWKQVMRHNTPKVWEKDGVMVFCGEGLTHEMPTEPEIPVGMRLADKVMLVGYSRVLSPSQVHLVLFWQVLARMPTDYTTFVHIRNQVGETVTQVDVLPMAGEYPTSRWRVGETVVDTIVIPIPASLAPGAYRVLVGLYQWDTLERLGVVDDASGENAIELETIRLP